MADESLRLEGVSVGRAGRLVLRDIDLEVRPASVTVLLGPNGAGKSSLVLATGGVLPLAAGTIRLGEVLLSGRRPERVRAAGVAIVPEGRRLLPELTTRDNLRVATYTLGKAEAKAGMERALELFPELETLMGQVAGTLSGGQQQMVVLAQALVSLADRAYVLEGGRLRYEGTTEALRRDPDLLHSAYLLRGYAGKESALS